MTLEMLSNYGWLCVLVLQGFFAWTGWSLKKRFVTREDFEADMKKLSDVFSRDIGEMRNHVDAATLKIDRCEARLEDMPSQTEIHELSVALEKLSGRLGGLVERVEAAGHNQDRFERVLNRIEDYLLNGAKK
ncbi:DUF2730 family protein [Thalassospira marina]|uniref:DUF2730 domain-containing protein n=1 Tax=Thalassospira marina TaxID=2048283 RepID=A0ABN5FGW2_9PROT|nr:DUF2730 family protein [Thalassospira marina]AUG53926.1 hypothetical protein CSC3H3_15275 [Thalassospira marina]